MTSLSGSGRDLAAEYRVGYDAIRSATALRERGLIVTCAGTAWGRASARPAPLLRVKHPQSSAGNARTGALAGVAWGPRIVMRITSSAHTSKIAATRNEVAMPCVST
jgi:hypothetical protein